jgi:hypothetical protein
MESTNTLFIKQTLTNQSIHNSLSDLINSNRKREIIFKGQACNNHVILLSRNKWSGLQSRIWCSLQMFWDIFQLRQKGTDHPLQSCSPPAPLRVSKIPIYVFKSDSLPDAKLLITSAPEGQQDPQLRYHKMDSLPDAKLLTTSAPEGRQDPQLRHQKGTVYRMQSC